MGTIADMSTPRATTSRLAPGEDTIGRAKARGQTDGMVWLDWSYRPVDGSKVVRRRAKGHTLGEARRRARIALDELRTTGGVATTWRTSSDMADYITNVSRPAIARAQLAQLSMARYEISLKLLLGECEQHRHRYSFKQHTIASGTRFRALEDLLTEIGQLHGREAARQARTVLTKYVLTGLIRDALISGNPIAGIPLGDLTGTRKGTRSRGGKALSRNEYFRVLDYLLALDPAEGIVRGRGRWDIDHLIARRRNSIDQALLQAATGLRSSEANQVTWLHVADVPGQPLLLDIEAAIAKGGRPRTVMVLDERVADRLRQRPTRNRRQNHIIGAPTDPQRIWDQGNRNKAARDLYLDMARDLEIELLQTERSHLWRTTLHTLYADTVATAVLDAQFGNTERVRAKHYTDASDLSALIRAAKHLSVSQTV